MEAFASFLSLVFRLLFFLFSGASLVGVARSGMAVDAPEGPSSKKRIPAAAVHALIAAAALLLSSLLANGGGDILPFALFLVCGIAFVAIAHRLNSDCNLIAPVILLLALGVAMAAETSAISGSDVSVVKSVGIIALGLACALLALLLFRNYDSDIAKIAKAWPGPIFLAGLMLLLLPFFFGTEQNGALNWISIAGFSLQVSEFSKIILIFALAGYCADRGDFGALDFSRHALFPLIVAAAVCFFVVVLEHDLGFAAVMGIVAVAIVFASSRRRGWFYLIFVTVLLVGLALVASATIPYVRSRFEVWLNPYGDPAGSGFQFCQSGNAITNGGVLGTGLSHGVYCDLVPNVWCDSIIAAIGEQLGLVGVVIVVLSFACLGILGAKSATRLARGSFDACVNAGLSMLLLIGGLVNLSGSLNLLPQTGVTLPFVSAGGSSMLCSLCAIGIILGFSARRPEGSDAPCQQACRNEAILKQRLGIILLIALPAAFIGCIVWAGKVQHEIPEHASETGYEDNGAQVFGGAAREVVKGTISLSDGTVVAENVDDERVYPLGTFASHVVGALDSYPGFSTNKAFAQRGFKWDTVSRALALPLVGDDAVITLDSTMQRAAEAALAGEDGAIVVLDVTDGRIVAMASSDPVDLSQGEGGTGEEGGGGSYFSRATQSAYAPGSTFKLVTLAAALENGVSSSDIYDAPAELEVGGAAVRNAEGVDYGSITVADATVKSVNTVYAQMALDVGKKNLGSQAAKLGLNDAVALYPFATSASSYDPSEMGTWEFACSGFGQPVTGDGPYATPLALARVIQAVANGGKMCSPYIIEGSASESTTAFSKRTADSIRKILKQDAYTFDIGWGVAYGKTGTAERSDAEDNSLWIGIAEDRSGNAKYAICTVIEEGGAGSDSARPKSLQVLGSIG